MAYIGFDIENRLHNTAFTFDSYTSDGVTSIYALSVPKPLTSRAVLVSFDGLTQQPELDYTLDGESNLKIINIPATNCISKYELLNLIKRIFKKRIIINKNSDVKANRCLTGTINVKDINKQLVELKKFYYDN